MNNHLDIHKQYVFTGERNHLLIRFVKRVANNVYRFAVIGGDASRKQIDLSDDQLSDLKVAGARA